MQKNIKSKEIVLDCLRSFMKNEKDGIEDHSRRMFYLITDKAQMVEECPCCVINTITGDELKCKIRNNKMFIWGFGGNKTRMGTKLNTYAVSLYRSLCKEEIKIYGPCYVLGKKSIKITE